MSIPQPASDQPPSNRAESDRRRWARAAADVSISVTLADGHSEARVRDISRAGVCFFLDRPIPLMTVLEMSMQLRTKDGWRRIGGYGAVVRCEKIAKAVDHYEIALFLNEMTDADRRCIEEYVSTWQRAQTA
jgi:hypothetical protein